MVEEDFLANEEDIMDFHAAEDVHVRQLRWFR